MTNHARTHLTLENPRRFAALLAAVALLFSSAHADDIGSASDGGPPGIKFPSEVAVTHGETSARLALTGMDVLRKYFVDVYWVAHYMQDPPDGSNASIIKTVLTDGPVKQLTLQFVRNVKAKRLKRGIRQDLKKNATDAELNEMAPTVERFVASVRDAQTDDQFILRWLPGGKILATHHDEVVFDVTNPKFARVLWSIWFGERSIVEREALISRVSSGS